MHRCMFLIRIYILLQHGNHLTILTFEFHYFIYDLQIFRTMQYPQRVDIETLHAFTAHSN